MHKKGLLMVGLLLLALMGLSACGGSQTASEPKNTTDSATQSDEKLQVAVTIVPQATFVEKVGADMVETHILVPPGYAPEQFEPNPQDMAAFENADLYFSIGVPVEAAQINRLAQSNENLTVVSLQDAVAAAYPDREFAPGERDAHIWLSPKRTMVMVNTIADALAEADPANAETYQANAAAYLDELQAVDADIKAALVDVSNPTFICYHPAFGYLADDYGLTMLALEEEGKEANPARLKELTDLAKAENIRVVFYQDEIDSRQAAAFAEEIGGETVQLAPLAADYTDNLQRMADTIAEAMV